jgi:hypothetical protein
MIRLENCSFCRLSEPIPDIKNVIVCHNDSKFTEIWVGCFCLNFKQKQLTEKTKEKMKRRVVEL